MKKILYTTTVIDKKYKKVRMGWLGGDATLNDVLSTVLPTTALQRRYNSAKVL